MDELDIRKTVEAREQKAAVMLHEESDGLDGWECPVCGEQLPAGADEIVGAAGVGDYHISHLSDQEIGYVRDLAERDEQRLDSAAFAEEAEKSNTELYGDAVTRGPQ